MADLVGAHVTLTGLVARAELNGRRGVVLSYSAERGVFLPVALGVPWGGNAEARVYLGEYLGWN